MCRAMTKTHTVTEYNEYFFDYHSDTTMRSARIVVPLVLDLVPARSVVDVGCGRGIWLSAFRENGVQELRGLDGAYVDRTKLLIRAEEFEAVDLEQPVRLDRRYDLALCLEVGEHLSAAASGRL